MAEKWQRWMPFHIDRWRGSPDVRAMHPAARMGYLELLCSCWQSSDCSISDDAIDLATNSGLGDELWVLYGARILRKFVLVDGRYRNEVIFEEWSEALRVYQKRKSGAVRTNSSRSANEERTDTERPADTHTHTSTETYTETKEQKEQQAASAFVLPEWIDKSAWQGYEEMRKKIRKPMTDRARALAVSELVRLEARGHPAEKVLDQSTQNSWQGLFELKTNGGNGHAKPTIDASVAARQALLDRRREGRMAANGDTGGGIIEAGGAGAERLGAGSANGTLFRTA